MAASRKKRPAARKANRKKTGSGSVLRSPLFRLGLLVIIMAVSVMALFHLGTAGTLLFQLGTWGFGWLSWLFWTAGILVPFWLFWTGQKERMPRRYWVSMVCMISGLALFLSALAGGMPWSQLQELASQSVQILNGQAVSPGGFLGSLLYGICASLFSRAGSFVAALFLIVLAMIPFLYDKPRPNLKTAVTSVKERAGLPESAPDRQSHYLSEEADSGSGKKKRRPSKMTQLKADKTPVRSRTSSFTIIDAADPIGPEEPETLTGIDIRAEDIAGTSMPSQSRREKKPARKASKASDRPREKQTGQESKSEKSVRKASEMKTQKPEPDTSEPVSLIPASDHFEGYSMPRLNLLDPIERKGRSGANRMHAREQGEKLIEILREFSVDAQLKEIHIGPSVTKFEVKPEMGVRVSRISNLQNDIQMALGARDIRIEAPIPGKSAVGIEIPNAETTPVQMKDLMSGIPQDLKEQKLLFALGKDLQGENVYGRLDRMPHLLIAGATGSGKSVCVNSIICSLLMRTRPDDVKLILIDPKKVEFTPYADVPHLLAPVITDSDLANKALKVVVEMMDHRYDLFGLCGVRNITAYNAYLQTHPEETLKPLPRIVVIIDELADLMLAGAKEVEQSIQRITQLARAAGIHLVVATQRPSVDVITGVIKANIPSRIAFAVSSAVDSRTILDQTGAERLLGYGDMLYLPNGETSARRIQGVFIKDDEVTKVSDYVKSQAKPRYDDAFITLKDLQSQGGTVSPEAADPLYEEVKHFVIQSRKASTSLIQRRFSIGYARAARLMDVLEQNGIIGPSRGAKPREILVEQPYEDPE